MFEIKIWKVQFENINLKIFVFGSFNFVKSLIPKKYTEIEYLIATNTHVLLHCFIAYVPECNDANKDKLKLDGYA